MRVIVTGGGGFLGSHVADGLAAAGHDVTVLDLVANPRHRSVSVDFMDPEALKGALRGVEGVCHLRAVGDVYLAGDKPALASAVNVVGTANVCDAALVAGVRRVVLASTWEVYGEPHYQPLDERHPCEPDHPYSITKLAGERVALSYARLKKLDVLALRLGTAFGTRMRPNSVFSIFIRRALAKEPITIQGSGQQGRQFTHASDIARGFAAALERGEAGEIYNLVSDEMVSIRDLAEMVVAEIPTELTYGEARPGEVPSALVSNERAKSDLGWKPQMPFAKGLAELITEARQRA